MIKIKNKRVFGVITAGILIMAIIVFYKFKRITVNDIYDKPNFIGRISEVSDSSILVLVNEDEDEIKSSDKIVVPLNTKLKSDATNFKVGDNVNVFYDGEILESYPAKISTVYKILLVN